MTHEIRNQIDGLIVECENAVQHIHHGRGIAFCATMASMVQKLDLLKQQLETDAKSAADPAETPAFRREELP